MICDEFCVPQRCKRDVLFLCGTKFLKFGAWFGIKICPHQPEWHVLIGRRNPPFHGFTSKEGYYPLNVVRLKTNTSSPISTAQHALQWHPRLLRSCSRLHHELQRRNQSPPPHPTRQPPLHLIPDQPQCSHPNESKLAGAASYRRKILHWKRPGSGFQKMLSSKATKS